MLLDSLDPFIDKYKRKIIITIVLILVVPLLLVSQEPDGIFLAIILFILVYIGMLLVLGFQFINPFASKKVVRFACNFFLIILTFIEIGIYVTLWRIIGAYYMRRKYHNRKMF